jgi:hypothetical protein
VKHQRKPKDKQLGTTMGFRPGNLHTPAAGHVRCAGSDVLFNIPVYSKQPLLDNGKPIVNRMSSVYGVTQQVACKSNRGNTMNSDNDSSKVFLAQINNRLYEIAESIGNVKAVALSTKEELQHFRSEQNAKNEYVACVISDHNKSVDLKLETMDNEIQQIKLWIAKTIGIGVGITALVATIYSIIQILMNL